MYKLFWWREDTCGTCFSICDISDHCCCYCIGVLFICILSALLDFFLIDLMLSLWSYFIKQILTKSPLYIPINFYVFWMKTHKKFYLKRDLISSLKKTSRNWRFLVLGFYLSLLFVLLVHHASTFIHIIRHNVGLFSWVVIQYSLSCLLNLITWD